MNAPVVIKGWCPTALRPMMSGDGLLVRVRVKNATLLPADALALADFAETFGNGLVDLTQRANLQIRGVRDECFPALIDALRDRGLVDPDDDRAPPINLVTSPLAGCDTTMAFDPRPLASVIEVGLRADETFQALPPKFGLVIDAGGLLSLDDVRADIRIVEDAQGMRIGLDGTRAIARVPRAAAPAAALGLGRAFLSLRRDERRMRALVARIGAEPIFAHAGLTIDPFQQAPRHTAFRPLGAFCCGPRTIVGVAAPFGSWAADDLAFVARRAGPGATLRLTTCRVLLLVGIPDDAITDTVDVFRARGLIVSGDDPRLAVAACAGAPACPAASVETRSIGAALAARIGSSPQVVLHVSGCAKGCAHPSRAPLALVGTGGRYDLAVDAVAGDAPALVGLDALAAARAVCERVRR